MNKQTTLFLALIFCSPLFAMEKSSPDHPAASAEASREGRKLVEGRILIMLPRTGEQTQNYELLDPEEQDIISQHTFSALINAQHTQGNGYMLARVETEKDAHEYVHYFDAHQLNKWVKEKNNAPSNPSNNAPLKRLGYFIITQREPTIAQHCTTTDDVTNFESIFNPISKLSVKNAVLNQAENRRRINILPAGLLLATALLAYLGGNIAHDLANKDICYPHERYYLPDYDDLY